MIYPKGLLSNAKLFTDDTSIFSVAKDHLNSSNKLREDLSKIFQWAYQWEMSSLLLLLSVVSLSTV